MADSAGFSLATTPATPMRRRIHQWLKRVLFAVEARSAVPAGLLWSKGIAACCDFRGPIDYAFKPTECRQGPPFFQKHYATAQGLVWVRLSTRSRKSKPCDLDDFVSHALPSINRPFVLITTDGDAAVPSQLETRTVSALLESPFLTAWHTQNHDGFAHPKLFPFPIGLDLHAPRPEGGPRALANIIHKIRDQRPPASSQPLRVFCDVNLSLNSDERIQAVRQLTGCKHVDFLDGKIPQQELWMRYASHPFVLSVAGNGLDCHRTWEALYLGAIVIVKRSSLDPIFDGLPVAVVDDWVEVRDESRLAEWRERYTPLTDGQRIRERLHPEIWLAPLRAALAGVADESGRYERIPREA